MDRILTTHVGSLVRPDDLVTFLRAREAGEAYDEAAFDECLRRSVADVVRRQAETGIDIVSDGEFGKTQSWSRYIRDRLGGFEAKPVQGGITVREVVPVGADKRMFPEFYAEYDRTQGFVTPMSEWVCTGPITYTGQDALARDIRDLREAVEGVEVGGAFLPVVAPASAAPNRNDEHYAGEEEFLFAIADALHDEYAAISEAGLLVQVDDAHLANMHDRMVPPATLEEYRAWAELRIEALNHALRGIPSERVRYHVCWGSWNAPHLGDVGLRDIVDLVLRVNAGGLSIEQANPRHEHEWRVWEDTALPEGKVLLPGIVSHVTNVVEHPELVAERIVRLARLVGRERVIASTDCGFAQGPFVRRVHPSIMWAKLGALVEGAQLATRKLWA
jgi:5-methyltetrahydropteroyltriglutamate--homocysteine methyltransferase